MFALNSIRPYGDTNNERYVVNEKNNAGILLRPSILSIVNSISFQQLS